MPGHFSAMGLSGALLVFSGCAHQLGPLSPYNDHWGGNLQLDGVGTLPLDLRVYVTESDARDPGAEAQGKKAFAELEIDHVGPIAAWGDTSHFDFRKLDQQSHAPIPGREFLVLRSASAGAMVSTNFPSTQQCYAESLATILSKVAPGVLAAQEQGELELIAELHHDNLLEGIVVLRVSWTGDCAHREQGRCAEWHVGSRTVVMGTFRAARLGPTDGIVRRSPGTINSGRYIFQRSEAPPNGTSWTMSPGPGPLRCACDLTQPSPPTQPPSQQAPQAVVSSPAPPRDWIAWRRPNHGGDWIAFDGDVAVLVRSEFNTAEVIDVATGNTVSKDAVTGEKRSLFPSSLHLLGDLFVQTARVDPWLRVVETRTGKVGWTLPRHFETLDEEYLAVGRSNGMVVLGDANPYDHKIRSTVVGLRESDGRLGWRRNFQTPYVQALVTAGDRAVIHTNEGLEGIQLTTGETLWKADKGYGIAGILVEADRLVYRDEKTSFAVRSLADGRLLGRLPMADPFMEPRALHGDHLVLVKEDSVSRRTTVSVADLKTLESLWRKDFESRYKGGRFLDIVNGRLLLFTGWDVIRSLDLRTGDEAVPLGFPDINQVTRVAKGGQDYLIVNTLGAGAFGQEGEFIALRADAWPDPSEVTITGCATIKVDRRLCRRPTVRVRVGDLTVPTDKKGCFKASLAARGALHVRVDELALLENCRATKKMDAVGEFPCGEGRPVKLRIVPDVTDYRADVGMTQVVCQDY
jgi:hypothetical protein